MEPWNKFVTPREEVCEGLSFNPDEFAIALEQVVAETAPEDYTNPAKFFSLSEPLGSGHQVTLHSSLWGSLWAE